MPFRTVRNGYPNALQKNKQLTQIKQCWTNLYKSFTLFLKEQVGQAFSSNVARTLPHQNSPFSKPAIQKFPCSGLKQMNCLKEEEKKLYFFPIYTSRWKCFFSFCHYCLILATIYNVENGALFLSTDETRNQA